MHWSGERSCAFFGQSCAFTHLFLASAPEIQIDRFHCVPWSIQASFSATGIWEHVSRDADIVKHGLDSVSNSIFTTKTGPGPIWANKLHVFDCTPRLHQTMFAASPTLAVTRAPAHSSQAGGARPHRRAKPTYAGGRSRLRERVRSSGGEQPLMFMVAVVCAASHELLMPVEATDARAEARHCDGLSHSVTPTCHRAMLTAKRPPARRARTNG